MPVSSTLATARRRSAVRRLLCGLAVWHGRHRQRLNLAELDDRLIAELGVNPRQARYVSDGFFWG